MGRYNDWPKSPIRANVAPDVPLYISVPFWRAQLPFLRCISDHLATPTSDLMTAAALGYVSTFVTREALLETLAKDVERYCVRGKIPKMPFHLEWPDTP